MNINDVEFGGIYLCRIMNGEITVGYKPVIVIGITENEITVAPLSRTATTKDKTARVFIPYESYLLEDSFALIGKARTTNPENLVKHLYTVTNERTLARLKMAVRHEKAEKNNGTVICLCGICKSGFEDVPGLRVRRAPKGSKYKDSCTYCGIRFGFEYLLVKE